MIAFDAVDHATSQVLGIHDLGHELIVNIRHQQIRAWYRPMIFVAHCVDQLVDRALPGVALGEQQVSMAGLHPHESHALIMARAVSPAAGRCWRPG